MKSIQWIALIGLLALTACSPKQAAQTPQTLPAVAADSQVVDLKSSTPQNAAFIELDVQAALELMESNPDLVIVDVSSGSAAGRLPGALNIPLPQLTSRLNELDPGKPHLVYCYGDASAIQAAEILVNNGFSPVYRLLGNFQGWVAAGLPVEE